MRPGLYEGDNASRLQSCPALQGWRKGTLLLLWRLPPGPRLDLAWKPQALLSSGCVGSLGPASQLGAAAAVPGSSSPPGFSAELPVLWSPAALEKGGQE